MGHSICSVDGFDGAHMDHIIHHCIRVQQVIQTRDLDLAILIIIIIIILYKYQRVQQLCRDGIGCVVFPIHCNRSEIPKYAENRAEYRTGLSCQYIPLGNNRASKLPVFVFCFFFFASCNSRTKRAIGALYVQNYQKVPELCSFIELAVYSTSKFRVSQRQSQFNDITTP